jgi:hypothetical protein
MSIRSTCATSSDRDGLLAAIEGLRNVKRWNEWDFETEA